MPNPFNHIYLNINFKKASTNSLNKLEQKKRKIVWWLNQREMVNTLKNVTDTSSEREKLEIQINYTLSSIALSTIKNLPDQSALLKKHLYKLPQNEIDELWKLLFSIATTKI